ncbi:MAG: type II toxin-antitoxin system VapC family toxin [candidate division KSB1 bacterium]|nr:type II toxin-antitoxin system VapC family toxin [candidate division KSB1 bacterium]
MKYLLDTHVLLWALFDERKIPSKTASVIENPQNEIVVSVITYWELSLKYALGKLELKGILPEELQQTAEHIGFETLPLSPADAISFYRLPRIKHKDPFDRLIIWQAICQNLTLISKDSFAKRYKKFGLKLLWE